MLAARWKRPSWPASPSCAASSTAASANGTWLPRIVGLSGSHLVDYEVSETGSERWEINTKGAGVLARNVPFSNLQALLAGEGMEVLGGRPVPVDRVESSPSPTRRGSSPAVRHLPLG